MEPPAATTAAFASAVSVFTSRMEEVKALEGRIADGIERIAAVLATALPGAPPGPLAAALEHAVSALGWAEDALLKEAEADGRLEAEALAAVLRLAPLPQVPGAPRLSVVAGA